MREYSTREVAELSELSPSQIRRWARAGVVSPGKDTAGHWRFSFQDLALFRMAGRLLGMGVRIGRVSRTLRQLREQLPSRPLSAVRLVVVGGRVIVRDRLAAWSVESRQGVLSFDMHEVPASPDPVSPVRSARADERTAESLYQSALDLELAGEPAAAEAAYLAVLATNPDFVDAKINLGRLRQGAGRLADAEKLYRAALADESDNALAAFNLGVVLEDQGRPAAAIEAYRRAIAIDDAHADAHFNLSRLLEQSGDRQAALRHLARFRRLTR